MVMSEIASIQVGLRNYCLRVLEKLEKLHDAEMIEASDKKKIFSAW